MNKTTARGLLGLMIATSLWTQTSASQKGNQVGPQDGQSAEESFKKRDTNKDNFLSRTEISGSRVADSFDKIDTNKDGKLSLNEIKPACRAWVVRVRLAQRPAEWVHHLQRLPGALVGPGL